MPIKALKNLRICHWNAHGCNKKKAELQSFLIDHSIDICLLNETLITENKTFKIPGYNVYKNYKFRGTAIAIKINIAHYECTPIGFEFIEVTAIKIKLKGSEVAIVSVYNPPRGNFSDKDFKLLFRIAPSVLAVGDLNAKHTAWNSRSVSPMGSKIFRFCFEQNLAFLAPLDHTHVPYNTEHKPDILDIALLKNFNFNCDIQTVRELDSDHFPIVLDIELQTTAPPRKPKLNFAKTDWEKFYNFLTLNIPHDYSYNSKDDLSKTINSFTNLIFEAAKISSPLCKSRDGDPPLPQDIIDLIKVRNNWRNTFNQNHSPILKKLINNLRKTIEDRIRKFKCENWNNYVKKLNIKDNSIWKLSKALSRPSPSIPPLKDNNNVQKYISQEEKANCFATCFAKTFSPHETPSNPEFTAETDRIVEEILAREPENEIKPTTLKEVKKFLKKTKNNKAPGPDQITNFLLKNLPDFCLNILVNIINACFKLKYFPDEWKTANVLVFPKAGKDLTLPISYRPISLLVTMSKVLEGIFMLRLKSVIVKNNTLRNEQFGFRDGHTTQQQVIRVTEHISKHFNWHKHTGAVLLDVEKAFDSVWINGLIRKIESQGIPIELIAFIASYLSNRSFYVSVNDYKSQKMPIKAGVPQGSILGPTLFSLYINDMPKSSKVDIGVYADDTVFYTSSFSTKVIVKNLNEALTQVHSWCSNWRVKINAGKSEAIMFTKRTKKGTINNINPPELNSIPIPWKRAVKYLGVTLDAGLNFSQHITNTRNKALGARSKLNAIMNRNSSIGIKNGIIIYKAIIRPVMTYAVPVWGGAAVTNLNKLQIVQNKILRSITKSPRYTKNALLHKEVNMPLLKEVFHKLTVNFYKTAAESRYELISSLGQYDFDPRNKHKRPKDILRVP